MQSHQSVVSLSRAVKTRERERESFLNFNNHSMILYLWPILNCLLCRFALLLLEYSQPLYSLVCIVTGNWAYSAHCNTIRGGDESDTRSNARGMEIVLIKCSKGEDHGENKNLVVLY